jgi:hypothetical protein
MTRVCFRADMRPILATTMLVSICFLACDKGDSAGAAAEAAAAPSASAAAIVAPTASATASASASATAQAPAPKCPAGLTGNALPVFCIKLPAAYKVKDARTSPTKGSISYDTGTSTDSLMVSYDSSPLAMAKDAESELKFGGDKLEKKGDLPGGNKWFQGAHQDYERVVTLFKGQPPLTLKCSFAYQPKSAPPKDAIDACKSIVVPPP